MCVVVSAAGVCMYVGRSILDGEINDQMFP